MYAVVCDWVLLIVNALYQGLLCNIQTLVDLTQ